MKRLELHALRTGFTKKYQEFISNMIPLTDGYYLSDQLHSEEMHAGVRMTHDYYRFLKFYPDGFWLWSDRNSNNFDFASFVRQFDLNHWRLNHRRESPPTSPDRDGGHLFEFGTYESTGKMLTVTFYCPLAEMELSYKLLVSEERNSLTGWKREFHFHANSS